MKTKILDCTLRDGGYYTNWDFDEDLVATYLESFNQLPVDYIEVGYRNPPLEGYNGEYYYCPVGTMKRLNKLCNKPLAIILNEKSIQPEDVPSLLKPVQDYITLVRMAIDPANFERALQTAREVKKLGFELSFNVMYMSEWKNHTGMMDKLSETEGLVDYFYMVDSFGGVYPEDVSSTIATIRERTSVKLGFHGHNNLEMALANTLTAMDEGVDIVDATITGMGRGAGNLKMELLLTALSGKELLDVNFNALTRVTDAFAALQQEYGWGTSLPYMVSGANSLPQKQVMEWVSKRFYSYNSIIRALNNRAANVSDNVKLEKYQPANKVKEILIVGGGPSVSRHTAGIDQLLADKAEMLIIHASSRNVPYFRHHGQPQIHCLSGNEGYRLERVFEDLDAHHRKAVLPPYPRTMGTYIPEALSAVAFELPEIDFTDQYNDSITAVVLQLAALHHPQRIYVIGYDGYQGEVTRQQMELFQENEYLFQAFTQKTYKSLHALLPTAYSALSQNTLYQYL